MEIFLKLKILQMKKGKLCNLSFFYNFISATPYLAIEYIKGSKIVIFYLIFLNSLFSLILIRKNEKSKIYFIVLFNFIKKLDLVINEFGLFN